MTLPPVRLASQTLPLLTGYLQQLPIERFILSFFIVCVHVSADVRRGRETWMPLELEWHGIVSRLCGC